MSRITLFLINTIEKLSLKKSLIRKKYLTLRQALSEQDIRQRSKKIAEQFFDFLASHPCRCIHLFLPIQSKKEVDTWQIVQYLWRDFPEILTAVSKTDFEAKQLQHFIINPDTVLSTNAWGIPEPKSAQVCEVTQIDMVLVPLLAVDKQGHRVGYGKGFYDRFLAGCSKNVLTVGLSLFEVIPEIEDTEAHDIPLEYALTPTACVHFRVA